MLIKYNKMSIPLRLFLLMSTKSTYGMSPLLLYLKYLRTLMGEVKFLQVERVVTAIYNTEIRRWNFAL